MNDGKPETGEQPAALIVAEAMPESALDASLEAPEPNPAPGLSVSDPLPPLQGIGGKGNGKLNKQEVLIMALAGYSVNAIAKYYKVNHTAIKELIAPDLNKIKAFQAYKSNTTEYLKFKAFEILSSLDTETINKAGVQQRVWSFGVIFDKVRLLEGKSTDNVARSITVIVQEANRIERNRGVGLGISRSCKNPLRKESVKDEITLDSPDPSAVIAEEDATNE